MALLLEGNFPHLAGHLAKVRFTVKRSNEDEIRQLGRIVESFWSWVVFIIVRVAGLIFESKYKKEIVLPSPDVVDVFQLPRDFCIPNCTATHQPSSKKSWPL